MKVAVIPIVVGALGTIPKGIIRGLKELEIRWLTENVQTAALLKLRRDPETRGDLLSLSLQWKT